MFPAGWRKACAPNVHRSLALIVPDIQNQFWMTVARGVEDAAQSRATRYRYVTPMRTPLSSSIILM